MKKTNNCNVQYLDLVIHIAETSDVDPDHVLCLKVKAILASTLFLCGKAVLDRTPSSLKET